MSRGGPHLPGAEQGLDVVGLQAEHVAAGVEGLAVLLQPQLSGGQVVEALHPVGVHLLLLHLHQAVLAGV